ncbi:ATP-binding protein [Paeniglutamicibacter sp. NPDC012692]|uniref:ATP-binding protein n=1 Tax=Paeniglutamicibacter sp. NPDC012692 TaxID=3364388 RepID=UPI0036879C5B
MPGGDTTKSPEHHYQEALFSTWGEILGDTTVAAAMLDRLLHRSVVLNLDGESYRLRNHHEAAEQLRKATTGTPTNLLT